MNLKIQLVKTKEEYRDILEIRKKVFIEEQNVPSNIEIEYEKDSNHVICYLDKFPVGTGRWRNTKNAGPAVGKAHLYPQHRLTSRKLYTLGILHIPLLPWVC